jgi:CDP-diacylglycerol--glycerol-3-phosphate 3-phosphatidyltransferase
VNKNAWQERGRGILDPLVGALARSGATPTGVTLVGLGLNIVSGVIIGMGRPLAGGLLLIVAGVCDALDGQLARRTGKTSRFGAFLDSTVDRIDETVVLAGIAAFFLRPEAAAALGPGRGPALAVAVVIALAGSLITSYARARAEGLGLECKVGAFERPERVVVTVLGLLLGTRALAVAVLVIVVLSWITVLQRVVHVRRVVAAAERTPGTPR